MMTEHRLRLCTLLQRAIVAFVVVSSAIASGAAAGKCLPPWDLLYACHGNNLHPDDGGLLPRLLPRNEVDSGRNTDVSLSTEVPQSEGVGAATGTAESTDGDDAKNTAEKNNDQLANDVQNMIPVDDTRDVRTIRRLRQLRKQLSSQIRLLERNNRIRHSKDTATVSS